MKTINYKVKKIIYKPYIDFSYGAHMQLNVTAINFIFKRLVKVSKFHATNMS